MRTLPELADVASDQQAGGMQLDVVVDRDQASRYSVLTQAVDDTLYDAFGQRQVSVIYTQLNQYRVILEAESSFRTHPRRARKNLRQIDDRPTRAAGHHRARRTDPLTPLSVPHQGQFPSVTISFNLKPGSFLGQAIPAIQAGPDESIGLPDTIATSFSGSAAEFRSSLASEPYLILAALVVIYIVLGVLYESYIHPITILSTLPSAGVGALLALIVCGMDLSLVALIGIILLIGIVKKNAIMMIDFALEAERDQGISARRSPFTRRVCCASGPS